MRFRKRFLFAYFGLFARAVLRMRRPRIVGITGTVGKTTTKEVIAAVLGHPRARPIVGMVRKSPGNLNDNFGLPLAVLGYEGWPESRADLVLRICAAPLLWVRHALVGRYPDVLVLEYAASFEGDIPYLAALAPPTVAVVTAIGPAHLEVFGTMERLADHKGALARAVPRSGLVVLGEDNPYIDDLAGQVRAPVIRASGIGRALSDNIARAVGDFFGVPADVIEEAIRWTPGVRHRLEFQQAGSVTLIDDSVNANPLSMKLALETLDRRAAPAQRKVALLGYMAELGSDEQRYHEEIGAFARTRADFVVGVGPLARLYAAHRWFETVEQCIQELPAILRPGDLVLVKGSAASGMKTVASAIEGMAGDDDPDTEASGVAQGRTIAAPRRTVTE